MPEERLAWTLSMAAGSGRGAAVVRELIGLLIAAARWAAWRWGIGWRLYGASVAGDPMFRADARARPARVREGGEPAPRRASSADASSPGAAVPAAVAGLPVARVWSGSTRAADADRYVEYVTVTGVREMRAVPGNLGVLLLRRTEGDRAEFIVVSLWDSMAALRSFAGREAERAVFYPEDRGYLVSADDCVRHYEVWRGM